VEGFEKAVRLDPRYAIAYAGWPNAHFLLYEATRARNAPDASRLATAIGHARRSVDLDDTLARGARDARVPARERGPVRRRSRRRAPGRRARAAGLAHLFRLGTRHGGSERLDALRRALAIYGELAFVHFEIAMVHIARGQLASAVGVLRQGIDLQDRQAGRSWRYPASGLHWLLGVVLLAEGDAESALDEFRWRDRGRLLGAPVRARVRD